MRLWLVVHEVDEVLVTKATPSHLFAELSAGWVRQQGEMRWVQSSALLEPVGTLGGGRSRHGEATDG